MSVGEGDDVRSGVMRMDSMDSYGVVLLFGVWELDEHYFEGMLVVYCILADYLVDVQLCDFGHYSLKLPRSSQFLFLLIASHRLQEASI